MTNLLLGERNVVKEGEQAEVLGKVAEQDEQGVVGEGGLGISQGDEALSVRGDGWRAGAGAGPPQASGKGALQVSGANTGWLHSRVVWATSSTTSLPAA